ncbi:MAG TPA: PilZ domain-containing protein [Pyrinomonadaceae bacterium]|jgi:hypothetical protein|nr:PilZ domain-containing protein [Pyrinomonadaceae bacterium]
MMETCYVEETSEEMRRYERHDASLSYSIVLNGAETGGAEGDPPVLMSHTRDIGAGGMALLVPSLPFMYRYMLGSDCTLRFTLHLPDGPIHIEAVPVYDRPLNEGDMDLGFIVTGYIEIESTPRQYERYEKERAESACLIGVRIKKMSESDRAYYSQYIDILEIERSMKILTDESDGDSALASDELPSGLASTASRPRHLTSAPYQF